MYVIKMGNEKELITTVRSTIYQNERRADTLVFLIPRMYENIDFADCTLKMYYVTPSGNIRSETLEMEPEPYNEEYYRYHLRLNTRFTSSTGEIRLWLNGTSVDRQTVLESGETIISVKMRNSTEGGESIPEEELSHFEELDAKIATLQASKADGFIYDNNLRKLQLTANGINIGNAVIVPADGYIGDDSGGDAVWGDMEDSV